MTDHKTGTREEWLAARLELLKAEKEHTRRGDELARSGKNSLGSHRQTVPLRDRQGSASLADLFRGRSQLLVYHYMFGPDYTAGCATCSTIADGFNGFGVHLAHHDVTLMAVSRAPLARSRPTSGEWGGRFRGRRRSARDFNHDFACLVHRGAAARGRHRIQLSPRACVAVTQRRGVRDPHDRGPCQRQRGDDRNRHRHVHAQRPGMSALVLEDGVVYHVYSAYARGIGRPLGHVPVARPRSQGSATRRACGGAATTNTTTSSE